MASGPPAGSQQYDLSPKEIRLVQERAKMRAEFRAEFLKQHLNPHRHGHGGYLFDPAMQRWMSARAQHFYYFKPSYKSAATAAFVFFSCIAYGHWIAVTRAKHEDDYRKGKVSYRDREFKFV